MIKKERRNGKKDRNEGWNGKRGIGNEECLMRKGIWVEERIKG